MTSKNLRRENCLNSLPRVPITKNIYRYAIYGHAWKLELQAKVILDVDDNDEEEEKRRHQQQQQQKISIVSVSLSMNAGHLCSTNIDITHDDLAYAHPNDTGHPVSARTRRFCSCTLQDLGHSAVSSSRLFAGKVIYAGSLYARSELSNCNINGCLVRLPLMSGASLFTHAASGYRCPANPTQCIHAVTRNYGAS